MGAGVVRVKGTTRALAMSVDGNGRYCYLDPRAGAHARGRRGGAQRGVRRRRADRRDQLPELRQPGDARRSCGSSSRRSKGIAEACRALDVPITGGNVSLYNETDGQRDLSDAGHRRGRADRGRDAASCRGRSDASGDAIVLLGESAASSAAAST